MTALRQRAAAAAVAAAAALLVGAPAAWAHAQLQSTSPTRGAVVKREPSAVVFKFDQTVEGNFGAVRVFDSSGKRVDQGDAFHPNSTGSELGVHLKPHLAEGTYTATYRVISADGHVVSSGFVFSIGKPGTAPGQTVAQLTKGSKTGPPTEIAFGIARGLQYASIAVAVGALMFMLWTWLPALRATGGGSPEWAGASEAFLRRLRTVVIVVAIAGAVTAAALVVLEGAFAGGISGWAALKPNIVREVLGTRFGRSFGLGVAAWAVAAAFAIPLLSPRRERAPVLRPAELGATGLAMRRGPGPVGLLVVAPLVYLVLMPALAGHASTQSPEAVLFPVDVIHVVAMSVWAGGLALLLFAVPRATRALEPADRTRLLGAVLGRFSPLALAAVGAIAVTGVIQAYIYVRDPGNLIHTAFGRAVLIKSIVLLGLIPLAAYNRQRSVPLMKRLAAEGAAPGRGGLLLRRALRGEVMLVFGILGVTAALVMYAPSIVAQTGPVNKTTNVGPAQLQMTVDPAKVGSNEIHLYLLNPKDGTQFTRAQEVDIAESLPSKRIGPLNQGASKAGPGHYIVPGALLSVPGTWQLTVTVLVTKFDEYTTTVKVPIR
ncbi:MAG: copper resistance protein CopC/CopD [Actinobacteria bacterium]|nr:copper resistance protein CopC/CopD [Actinomycetota bacterium]